MDGWVIFGFFGQIFFGARFFVQWLVSEIKKKSHVPIAFWYLSIFGGVLLLAYAIHIKDPVFIVGQGCGLFVYTRNLVLIKNHQRTSEELVT